MRYFILVAGRNVKRARYRTCFVGIELFVDDRKSGFYFIVDILGQSDVDIDSVVVVYRYVGQAANVKAGDFVNSVVCKAFGNAVKDLINAVVAQIYIFALFLVLYLTTFQLDQILGFIALGFKDPAL